MVPLLHERPQHDVRWSIVMPLTGPTGTAREHATRRVWEGIETRARALGVDTPGSAAVRTRSGGLVLVRRDARLAAAMVRRGADVSIVRYELGEALARTADAAG